jgi:hypothetical protein
MAQRAQNEENNEGKDLTVVIALLAIIRHFGHLSPLSRTCLQALLLRPGSKMPRIHPCALKTFRMKNAETINNQRFHVVRAKVLPRS